MRDKITILVIGVESPCRQQKSNNEIGCLLQFAACFCQHLKEGAFAQRGTPCPAPLTTLLVLGLTSVFQLKKLLQTEVVEGAGNGLCRSKGG